MANASKNINAYIAKFADWRGTQLDEIRMLINKTHDGLTECWKWNSPVWTFNGKNLLSIGGFKNHIKVVFFNGAHINDSQNLFNSGQDAKQMRSINLNKGDALDKTALQNLITKAVTNLN